MREKDTKGSNRSFATEWAFRRCCVKAELTFALCILMAETEILFILIKTSQLNSL